MSPESLTQQVYSVKTDVFAYGVTLWEICTRQTPWSGSNGTEVAIAVVKGKRLTIPSEVHPILSQLITSCWQHQADDRPDFKSILEFLERAKK